MTDPIYIVVMDDNASDTPLATIECVTFDSDRAEAERAALVKQFGHMEDVEIRVVEKHLS